MLPNRPRTATPLISTTPATSEPPVPARPRQHDRRLWNQRCHPRTSASTFADLGAALDAVAATVGDRWRRAGRERSRSPRSGPSPPASTMTRLWRRSTPSGTEAPARPAPPWARWGRRATGGLGRGVASSSGSACRAGRPSRPGGRAATVSAQNRRRRLPRSQVGRWAWPRLRVTAVPHRLYSAADPSAAREPCCRAERWCAKPPPGNSNTAHLDDASDVRATCTGASQAT